MARVHLRFDASASDDWLASVSEAFPDVAFRILASHPTSDGLLGIAEVEVENARGEAGGDAEARGDEETRPEADARVEAVLERFEQAAAVRSFEVVHADAGVVLVQYVVRKPATYDALRASGNLPRFPARLQDGWLHTEMTAPHERLSRFTAELAAAGVPYEVLSLTQSPDRTDLLTDRQWEFVAAAVERGYYESPRRCTLTDLAEQFGVAKSAASGVLHRAEGRIVSAFVSGATE